MPTRVEAPPRYRRAILFYTVAIGGPTLILLILGLQSVRRQQVAIDQLRIANLRLSVEQLAISLIERIDHLASACLRDQKLMAAVEMSMEPHHARDIRKAFDEAKARHPIAGELLVVDGDRVLFPALHAPQEGMPSSPIDAGDSVAPLLVRAEHLEFAQNRPDLAAQVYRTLASRTRSDNIRADTLARLARSYRKLGRDQAAIATYQQLVHEYADYSDRFSRPYGLIAALELFELSADPDARLLLRTRQDVAHGRWELAGDQVSFFLEELDRRIPPPRTVAPSRFLRQFESARAIEKQLPFRDTSGSADARFDVFTQGPERYHLYYRRVGERPTERQLALLLDLGWVERVLLPEVAQALSIPARAQLMVANDVTNEPMAPPSTYAALAGVLSSWKVTLQDVGGGSKVAIYRPSVLFAGTILFVLTLLVMGVLLLVRDVSREKALTRLRSDFVSAASHELRTPLTMIRLYAQTLLEDVDADREERRGSYEIIAEETERLKHLLDKVLDFSRVDRNRRKYRFERTSLHSVVTSAIELYEPQLRRRGFILERELSCDVPPVLIDPEAAMGAVLNLLDNAAKYSGASRRIEVRLGIRGGDAMVEVKDHGVGIDAAEHTRIFDQFYRCGHSTETGGYGLGLFLVKHVMDAHRGRVELTSEPEKGSRFRLVFPSADHESQASANGSHTQRAPERRSWSSKTRPGWAVVSRSISDERDTGCSAPRLARLHLTSLCEAAPISSCST